MGSSGSDACAVKRAGIAAALIAFCLGCLLIPLASIESDEAVFGIATFGGVAKEFSMSVFHHRFPLMIFYYAGSLKGLLYWPILHLFAPGLWSIRLPMVLAGAACVGLLYDLARRIANPWAAAIAALLLATDPAFLLTNTYDWGPVAMEHLLLLLSLALFIRGRAQAAFFVLGLGLWNKAVFTWALTGLAAGALLVYPVSVRRRIPNALAASRCLGAMMLGALPLLIYNLRQHGTTTKSNVHFSLEGLAGKISSLRYTLDGSGLFGVVAPMDGVTSHDGLRFHSLFLPAVVVSFAFALWKIRSREFRGALFAAVFCAGTFAMILLTRYTGAAHHIVLLYPMPQLLVAVAVGSIPRRWLSASVATLLVGSNLLIFTTYLEQLHRFGAFGLFSDANTAMSAALENAPGHVYPIDYGLCDNTWLMHSGKLPIVQLWVLAQPETQLETDVRDANALFLDRPAGHEYIPGVGEKLDVTAAHAGLRRVPVRMIADSRGRPQIEIFRYAP